MERGCKKIPSKSGKLFRFGEFYNKCLQYKEAIQVFRKVYSIVRNCIALQRPGIIFRCNESKGEAINAMKKAKELGLEKRLQKQAEDILKRWEPK